MAKYRNKILSSHPTQTDDKSARNKANGNEDTVQLVQLCNNLMHLTDTRSSLPFFLETEKARCFNKKHPLAAGTLYSVDKDRRNADQSFLILRLISVLVFCAFVQFFQHAAFVAPCTMSPRSQCSQLHIA